MQQRILIIGGGLAGLSAAATAARAGADVTVLEARSDAGGRGRTHDTNGFLLNEGAHALYANGPGWDLLAGFGIAPTGQRPPLSPAYGLLRGRLARLPGTPLDALRTRLVGPRAKGQLGRLLAKPQRVLSTAVEGRSMAEWIDEQVSDADARAVVAAAARTATYCGDLSGIAADAAVPQMAMALIDGVRYLDGGWRQIVDALAAVAEGAGAKIVTGTKVGSISDAHESHGGFDATILAAGGPAHCDTLLEGASETVSGWAATLRPVWASALDLGMRRLPVDQNRFVMGMDRPLYLSVHTPSAALAPGGGEVVHLLRYGGDDVDGVDGETNAARADLEGLLDLAQPGWRSEVAAERFGRRLVVAHGRPEPGVGCIGRPGPAVADAPGVFVAGDWVGPVGLLADASLVSGAQAARRAMAAAS